MAYIHHNSDLNGRDTHRLIVHVRNLHGGAILHPGANLHPGCIFGHVNGVLRICTRVQIYSCPRGGANLFAPRCKLCT